MTSTTTLSSHELATPLLDSVDTLADELVRRILAAEHAYVESTLLTHDQLRAACVDNIATMIDCLAGVSPLDLTSARDAGRLKAEQGVPLAALLHAFRLGGRLIWEELMGRFEGDAPRTLLEMAAQVWAIVDVYSDAAADAYRQSVDSRAEQDAEGRRRLVRALFADHRANAGSVADALRTFRIPDRGFFAVLSVEDVGDVDAPGVESIWDSEVDGRVGLLFAGSQPVLEAALSGIVGENVGVSAVFLSPAGTPRAVEQARLARRCAREGGASSTRYEAVPIPVLLASNPDSGREAAYRILGRLLDLADDERASLLGTLDAWFESKGSTAEAAGRLHYHRNTVLYRLRRITELTGRDYADPIGAAELFVGLRAYQILGVGVSGSNGTQKRYEGSVELG